jgi:hypothetical protein
MSIVVGTNSYVTEAQLTAYASARGVTIAGQGSVLLTLAMDYLESLNYIGEKTAQTQSLQWPRMSAFVDNNLLDKSVVPEAIKNAQMATAISIDQGVDPLSDLSPAVKREKADVVEVEYQDGAQATVISRRINAQLRKYLRAGGVFNFAVTRA